MSDEMGGQLAEFDGVTFNEIINGGDSKSSTSTGVASKQNELIINKLPRSVSFAQGISFERDEIHFNIDLGAFATLRLISRYPTLNASNPASLSSANMQSRKELVLKDHVGSVSQVIDIATHKIVERNASEPFGLARGIPLLSNSILASYKEVGNRQDVSLYTNPQSNMRDNWEGKSFEILGSSNSNELQGMRGTEVFAKGKFSASTGLSNMGVRTLDTARGVWLSPDLYMGRNLEGIVNNPLEANLFQYANNNPISNNDPTGMFSDWGSFKDRMNDIGSGNIGGGRHDTAKDHSSGGRNDGGVGKDRNRDLGIDVPSGSKNIPGSGSGGGFFNFLSSAASRINNAINSPEMEVCAKVATFGLATALGGVVLGAGIVATTVPSAGASVVTGSPLAGSMVIGGTLTGISALACMTGIIANASVGETPQNNYKPPGNPKLPKDPKSGEPVPSSEAPHSQIGVKEGRKGDYRQTRQWSEDGKLQKTTDWTNHGRKDHASPHDHISSPNTTGGTPKRDDGVPWSLTL